MHMGRLHIEVRALWRVSTSLQETYGTKAVQVPFVSALFLQIRPPFSAHETTLNQLHLTSHSRPYEQHEPCEVSFTQSSVRLMQLSNAFWRLSSEYYGTSGCRKSEVTKIPEFYSYPVHSNHLPYSRDSNDYFFVNLYRLDVINLRHALVVVWMGLRTARLCVFWGMVLSYLY